MQLQNEIKPTIPWLAMTSRKNHLLTFAFCLLVTFFMIPLFLILSPVTQEDVLMLDSIKAFALMTFSTVVGIFVLWVFLRRELQAETDYTLLGAGVFYLCYTAQCTVSFPFSPIYKGFYPEVEVLLQTITSIALFFFLGFHLHRGKVIMFVMASGMLLSLLWHLLFYLARALPPSPVSPLVLPSQAFSSSWFCVTSIGITPKPF